jgi:hypothetical protein
MSTARRDTLSFGTRGFLFALILAFIFYLHVSEMVRRHFFSGGAPESPKTLPSWTPFGRGPPFRNEPRPQLNTMDLLRNEFSPPADFPKLIPTFEVKEEVSARCSFQTYNGIDESERNFWD